MVFLSIVMLTDPHCCQILLFPFYIEGIKEKEMLASFFFLINTFGRQSSCYYCSDAFSRLSNYYSPSNMYAIFILECSRSINCHGMILFFRLDGFSNP